MTHRDSERLRRIREKAKEEIEAEDFREAVDRMKVKLREGRWWHRFFPFVIIIRKRTENE